MEGIIRVWRWKTSGRICLMVLVLALALSGLFARPAQAQSEGGGTIVRCEPTSVTADVGEEFFIDFYIQDVVNLQAADVGMTFDPNIAEAIDMQPATPATIELLPIYELMTGLVIPVQNYADNTTGKADYAAGIFGVGTAVSGSGSIARLGFLGLQNGSFTMEHFVSHLSDPNGGAIPHTTQDCLVTIGTPTAVHLSATSAGQSSSTAVAVGVATLLLGVVTGWGVWHRRSRPGEV